MNKLSEGVAGKQIVKHFEKEGKVAVKADSVGSTEADHFVYRITFEDGEVSDYRWKWTGGLGFEVESVEKIERKGTLADDDGALVTIQAKALITDGEVTAVRLTGVSALSQHAVIGIAYEAIHATYGSVHHRRVPVFTEAEWVTMRQTEPESFTVPVHTY